MFSLNNLAKEDVCLFSSQKDYTNTTELVFNETWWRGRVRAEDTSVLFSGEAAAPGIFDLFL